MAAAPPPPTALLDLLPDAVCVVDPDGHLLYANAAFERILGYPPTTLLGRPVFELIHPDDREATREQAARVMGGTGQRHFRNRYLHRDGQPIDLLWSAHWLPQYGVRVGVARDVSELRRVEQALEHRAYHDALTGLPNRRRLRDLLEAALAHGETRGGSVALLYIDLDGFKAINDAHGHPAGDRALVEAARRLQAGLRDGDTVARVGGDEFVALLPGCDAAGAVGLADSMHLHLQRPFDIDGHATRLVASIGLATFPANGREPDALLAHADAAMYRSKRRQPADGAVAAAMHEETRTREGV